MMKTQTVHTKSNGQAFAETCFPDFAGPLIKEATEKASSVDKHADMEELHKLRVALRRLRTLLWAYRPMLDRKVDDEQRAVFKFLANAAGNTRDWDILIGLVESSSDAKLLAAFADCRDETASKSRETLANAHVEKVLREALHEVKQELNTSSARTPLVTFARARVKTAQKQLQKRMDHASSVDTSDYDAYHDVRKAAKKVRYLIEFFEPLLTKKQRKRKKALKGIQKRFGALNDVVASRALLSASRASLPGEVSTDSALRALKKAQKRRLKAAAKML
jgi:CHAD domain-containing protein